MYLFLGHVVLMKGFINLFSLRHTDRFGQVFYGSLFNSLHRFEIFQQHFRSFFPDTFNTFQF